MRLSPQYPVDKILVVLCNHTYHGLRKSAHLSYRSATDSKSLKSIPANDFGDRTYTLLSNITEVQLQTKTQNMELRKVRWIQTARGTIFFMRSWSNLWRLCTLSNLDHNPRSSRRLEWRTFQFQTVNFPALFLSHKMRPLSMNCQLLYLHLGLSCICQNIQ